ncbi:hypothetical protein EC844_12258 [Acinetobacter calcoaceticus]|uniref:Uncharacterized protein n=1 Tax=Acinetobacter calcoaceticus TaxID=471 RepID=A0A4R1XJ09_ACICA|nr:hypothetical protein EC844_12258 [Acinetobacter calcoaceticus]
MKIKYSLMILLSIYSVHSYADADRLDLKKYQASALQHQSLCKQIPQSCETGQDAQLYQVRQQPEQYYLIWDLKLYQLRGQNKQLQLLNQWDFSNDQAKTVTTHWTVDDEPEASDQRFIYPVLFRISAQSYAVALIQRFDEYYSGGMMTEEVADFFELKANAQSKLQFQNIPFSVYRMIRACFSEEDYLKGGDMGCHDEENLILNIHYRQPYTWQMKYHYFRTLSAASDQKPVNQRRSYLLQAPQTKSLQLPAAWHEY